MSDAIDAHGTLLQIGDGASPEVFTTIAEVKDIEGPSIEREQKEVTNHGSAGGWDEYLPGLKRGGEITFPINYVPTGVTHKNAAGGLLYELSQNDSVRNFKLVNPDTGATELAFSGSVSKFTQKNPVDGPIEAEVTIKLSGQPTLP